MMKKLNLELIIMHFNKEKTMFDTLSFVMLGCLFAELCVRRGGEVVTYLKGKLSPKE